MISLKKAILALGIGIGVSTAMTGWAAPGCNSCQSMGEQCAAGDLNACNNFDRLGCARYGIPGDISCEIIW